jgi:ketosteroid isomerase-like protein
MMVSSTMRRCAFAAAVVALATSAGAARLGAQDTTAAAGRRARVQAVVAAELAFSRAAGEKGVRDAFLEYLSDDGVIFVPRATSGKAFYAARPAPPILLQWRPEFVDASADGELGYTTGPWSIRLRAGEPVRATGRFFTVWRREKDGRLRALVDLGVEAPPTEAPDEPTVPSVAAAPPAVTRGSAIEDLRRADAELCRADAAAGLASALTERADPAVRLLRDGAPPAVGLDAAARAAAALPPASCRRLGGGLASSLDLGYTYGEYGPPGGAASAGAGNYLTVWRRDADGAWRAVALVRSAWPPDRPGAH